MVAHAPGIKRRIACLLAAAVSIFGCWASASAAELTGYSAKNGYQYVELGSFPQTIEAGQEGIVWRVLSVEDGSAYLLSEYVLHNARLHHDDVAYELAGGAFSSTELYAYLNAEFLSHFTAEEISMLQAVDGGLFTLLPSEDLKNKSYGFTGDRQRRGYATPQALQNGLFQYRNGSSPYWTRSQSASHAYAAICTKAEGNLGYIRVVVQNEGCRPACYLKLDSVTITGGNGTLQDPYQIGLLGGFGNP